MDGGLELESLESTSFSSSAGSICSLAGRSAVGILSVGDTTGISEKNAVVASDGVGVVSRRVKLQAVRVCESFVVQTSLLPGQPTVHLAPAGREIQVHVWANLSLK